VDAETLDIEDETLCNTSRLFRFGQISIKRGDTSK